MQEHALIEKERGCAPRSLQVERMHEKGNSEEAETIVARSLPKHRKGLRDRGRHHHSSSQSRCSTVRFRLVWAVSCFCAPPPSSYLPSTHISMRLAGPRSPLNVTYAAFSLYHLPLRDSSRLYSLIVNVLQPNPFFSTGRPTLMYLPSISVTPPAFAVAAPP